MNRLTFLRALAATYVLLFLSLFTFAQSRSNQLIQVVVSPDKPDWTYAPGDEVNFFVTVLQHQVLMENAEVSYAIGLEKMPPMQSGKTTLKLGTGVSGETVKL